MPGPKTRKNLWRRLWHVCTRTVRGVTRLEDTPYRIAMGCACGLFTTPLPILGQMLLGMGLARLFRANVVASMPWTWITNPLTTGPIWYGCYLLGAGLLFQQPVRFADIRALIARIDESGLVQTLREGGGLLLQVLPALWLGTVLVGLTAASLGYLAIRRLVMATQARRLRRHS